MNVKNRSKADNTLDLHSGIACSLFLLAPVCLAIGTGDPTSPSLVGLISVALSILCAISAILKMRLMIFVFVPPVFLLGLMTIAAPYTGLFFGPIIMLLSACAFILALLAHGDAKRNRHSSCCSGATVMPITEYSSDDEILLELAKITHIILLMSKERSSASRDDIIKLYKETNPEICDIVSDQANKRELEICFDVVDDSFLKDAVALSLIQYNHRKKMCIPFTYSSIFQPTQISSNNENSRAILETVFSSNKAQCFFTHNSIKSKTSIAGNCSN